MGKAAAPAVYECSECGWRPPKWAGRCAECQAWGSVVEVAPLAAVLARRAARARCGPDAAGGRRPDRRGGRDRGPRARPTGMSSSTASSAAAGARRGRPAAGEPGIGSRPAAGGRALAAAAGRVLYVDRRGVGRPGAGAAPTASARSAATCPGCRDRLRRAARHVQSVDPALLDRRLRADHQRAGHRGGARRGDQIREVIRRADRAGQAPDADHRAGRARDQGRSVAGPRTLEHLVDVVLASTGLARPATDGARPEEPVRSDGRDRAA